MCFMKNIITKNNILNVLNRLSWSKNMGFPFPILFCHSTKDTLLNNNIFQKMQKDSLHRKSEFWSPCENLISKCKDFNYAVLILNSPLDFKTNPTLLKDLWNKADIRVTVDGGTDRWISWIKSNSFESDTLPPNLITGDFDSVDKNNLNYFAKYTETHVIETPDQDATDFTKALKEVRNYCDIKKTKIESVFVLADTCGRLDQIIANLHTLYLAKDILPTCKLYQVSSNSITWLLSEGKHTISIPEKLRSSHECCALIPLGAPCRVTTTGLKWNLDSFVLEFDKFISTSNTYNGSPVVTVETDKPIVWSMGIESLL